MHVKVVEWYKIVEQQDIGLEFPEKLPASKVNYLDNIRSTFVQELATFMGFSQIQV